MAGFDATDKPAGALMQSILGRNFNVKHPLPKHRLPSPDLLVGAVLVWHDFGIVVTLPNGKDIFLGPQSPTQARDIAWELGMIFVHSTDPNYPRRPPGYRYTEPRRKRSVR